MTNQQMELGFGSARVCPSATRRQRRLSRANWWFERMREAVDRAFDWQPAPPPPRPEQIWFPE
jgi:hypothetical protein